MSTRQKSFFDQNQKPKRQGQWNRPRPPTFAHHNSNPAPVQPAHHVVSGPPIMPSSQTRKKLKSFQFVQDTPADQPGKENAAVATSTKSAPKSPTLAEQAPTMGLKPAETPKAAHSKPCPPSTPATRLPLADLVGNVDDSRRYAQQTIVSPDEQLAWRGSQPVSTPFVQRKRKRARSSSPVGPSQDDETELAIEAQTRTPLPDPAKELWSRYTSNKGTPNAHKAVAFAHLITDPSPRSSSTAGSVSGLRRWASCGTEFPASTKKKKRKTFGVFKATKDANEDVFAIASSDGAFSGPQEESKLAGMVQLMRESLRNAPSDLPSSSSPLPDISERFAGPAESPLQNRGHRNGSSQTPHHDMGVMDEEVTRATSRTSHGSSDEFGDADFDYDTVNTLEMSQSGAQQVENEASPPVAPVSPAAVATISDANQQSTIGTSSDDEFGLDEDDFVADLEQVASLYDCRAVQSSTEHLAEPSLATSHTSAATHAGAHPPVIDLVDGDDDDDEFGDDIGVDDFAAAEVAASQAPAMTSQQDARAIQRYLIKSVEEGSYVTDRGFSLPEKVLLVEEEKTKLFKAITLRQAWYDTPCEPNSFVHVIGKFSSTGQCCIDDHHNMLILHPDHLISATVVADSFTCLRRAVLQDRIKATSRANAPMLYGTLLHELFQEALKANRWDSEFLSDTIDMLLPAKFETILEINLSCLQVKEHMSSKLPELQAWAEVFIRAQPRADAIVRERNGRQSTMSINKLLDVEEHVWSPMYGLKGNIDATVQVVMQDDLGQRTLTVPFEVKTGKNSSNANHVAQTALYNLLLSNRYDVDVAYGILYYLETSDISRIPAIRNEIIHMIIKRNELACYVRQRIDLPPMLKEDFKCGKCYAQESCFLYHRLVEDGNGDRLNKKAKERYDELVRSLKPSDQDFMKRWDSLLTKEESDMMKFRRELWTMLSTEREKLGRCFSNVILEPGSAYEEKGSQKINRYTYTFIKQQPKAGFSFTESQLIIGEPVVVSDEQGHFALANGYVTNVQKRRITVAVDRRLHNSRTKQPGFNSQTNQTFAGIMEVTKEGETTPQYFQDNEPVLYRLDKDEFSNGMAAARNNLIQIMDDGVYKARELRSLIIDGRAPVFRSIPASTQLPPTSQASMNSDQRAAVAKVISAKDYALVLGMPGTGKTTTIAHIIRTLVAQKKSVLLTSYTHTAVDNILLKFRNDDMGILRLGAAAKIHPEVQQFATIGAEPKDSLEELEKSWTEPLIVATTCLTINHPIFSRRVFDYCIVDEASQITLPVCLGPIRMAQKFILVGDHHQLPPLVQNKKAAEGGLDVSLFKLLCDAHPEAVVSLEHQYRMCAEIMLLSNTFIYSGRLKCGTPTVASRRLALPNPSGLSAQHGKVRTLQLDTEPNCPGPASASCWLSRALDPECPVVFINTDTISTKLETQVGSRITNPLEAHLITQLTVSLLALGVPANDIGVIAFYRSQLALLRSSLASAQTQTQTSELAAPSTGTTAAPGVELHTADKFQGRDKEVVLVSSTRSNDDQAVGDLLKDQRRINVALTRARSKLVILGSERTLSGNDLLAGLVALCRGKGWVLDLSQNMVDAHPFDEGVSQAPVPVPPPHTARFAPLLARKPRSTPSPSPSPSPSARKPRRVLGDVSGSTVGNRGVLGSSPSPSKARSKTRVAGDGYENAVGAARRVPGKVFTAGRRGVLEGRPVLGNVFYEAL